MGLWEVLGSSPNVDKKEKNIYLPKKKIKAMIVVAFFFFRGKHPMMRHVVEDWGLVVSIQMRISAKSLCF